MAQILTIVRAGPGWAVRDVTGATYGRSSDIEEAIKTAKRLARRSGDIRIVLSPEAEQHFQSTRKT